MNYWNNYSYNQSLRKMVASQNVHDLVRKDHEHRDNAMYEYYNNKITEFINELNSHLHDMLQQLRNDYENRNRITVTFDLFFLTTNYEKKLYHELKHLVLRYNYKLKKLFKTSKFTLYNALTEYDRKVIYRNIILHNDFLYYTKQLLVYYENISTHNTFITPLKDTIVKELNQALETLQTTINSYLQLNFNLNQQIVIINNNSRLYVPPPRHHHHHHNVRTNLLMRI